MKKIVDTASVNPIIQYRRYILFFILAIAAAMRFQHVQWGLPDLYEGAIPFHVSQNFWNWDGNGITLDPSYFAYPAFIYYLNFFVQGAIFVIGYVLKIYPDFAAFQQMNQNNVTTFAIAGRCISTAFDLGTIALVYLLGKRLMDARTGLLAALIVALNPLHIRESNLINVDTPLTFFVVLALYFISNISNQTDRRWYILTGIAIGLAAASKYNGALMAVFFIIAQMINAGNLKNALQSLKNVNLWFSLAIALGVFLLFNPYILLRFGSFMAELNGTVHNMKYGYPGTDFGTSASWYSVLGALPQNLGWGLFIAVVGSVVYAWVHKRRQVLIMLIAPVIYICVLAAKSVGTEGSLLPVIPILILSGTVFLISIFEQFSGVKGESSQRSPTVKWIAAVAVLIIVFYFPLQGIASYSRKFTEPDTRALARQVISEHLQPDGVVVTGPFRINFPTESRVLTIPYNAQEPERYAAFHDLRWYRDLDFIIVSNPDGNKPDSGRFRDYLAFYNSLKAQATLIDSIALTEYNNGPSLWIYRLPSDTIDAPFDSTLIEKLQSAENGWETANFIDDLGMFLAGKGKYQKGEQALQYAVEHNSGLVIACQHLGTLQMRLGKYQEAADNFSGYLKQNPRDALMQCALGDAMYELNRLDEAEKGYLASIAIDGAYEDAYRGLVRVYTDKHDNASMIKVLERYLTYLPPTNQNAKMIRQKVEEMKQEANK